jgi:1-acyl-sn-glycerol-3-phosphate acyltransferase
MKKEGEKIIGTTRPQMNNEDGADEKEDVANPETTRSRSTQRPGIAGFLAFSSLMVATIVVNASLLVGLYLYPARVGLLVILPYYSYVLFLSKAEFEDGCHWSWFSRNFPTLNAIRGFLDIQCVVNEDLAAEQSKKDAQFVFAAFPHGSNADFRMPLDGLLHKAIPGVADNVRTLAATVLFRIPVVREIALWTGCVDARASVANKLLSRGRSVLVLPGGQAEQIRTVHGREILYLQDRKGFVKLAMKYNVPVVPIYVFGTSDYYQTSDAAHDFRLWLVKNLGVAIPLAWGMFKTPICPLPVATTVVFGTPIRFKCSEKGQPSRDEVASAHKEFCASLEALFDAHKHALGYGERNLEIQ